MGVFLVFAIVLVIAILFTIFSLVATEEKAYKIEYVKQDLYWDKKITIQKSRFWIFWYNVQECVIPDVVSIVCIVVSALVCIGLSIGAIVTSARRDIKYQETYQQYVVLTERLNADNNNYHLFYEDICAYNNAILEDRYWADNLWVNWYHNGKIQYLPLIGENTDNV